MKFKFACMNMNKISYEFIHGLFVKHEINSMWTEDAAETSKDTALIKAIKFKWIPVQNASQRSHSDLGRVSVSCKGCEGVLHPGPGASCNYKYILEWS